MIVDVECERCRGEGWLLTREPRLGSGLYETTCQNARATVLTPLTRKMSWKIGCAMSKSTISTFELFRMFPDQESARVYFEARRWPDGATCPACGEVKRIGVRKGGFYRCNACLLDFTIRTGTIFERSKVPLHKWLYAMYLLVTARKGISSVQLHAQIGVTQKTAWFMLQRLREACGNDPTELIA